MVVLYYFTFRFSSLLLLPSFLCFTSFFPLFPLFSFLPSFVLFYPLHHSPSHTFTIFIELSFYFHFFPHCSRILHLSLICSLEYVAPALRSHPPASFFPKQHPPHIGRTTAIHDPFTFIRRPLFTFSPPSSSSLFGFLLLFSPPPPTNKSISLPHLLRSYHLAFVHSSCPFFVL